MLLRIGDAEGRLVKRLRNGESGALRDFYALYADYMSTVCGRYVSDSDDLKDIVHDCLVNIAANVGKFEYRGSGSLQAWVTRIVVNQSLKYLKARKAHEFTYLDLDYAPPRGP